jgi:predicted nucleic acid-binding protein
MTLVLDASAVVDVLLRTDRGEQVLHVLAQRADEDMVTVAHLDAEVLSALARGYRAGELVADEVTTALRLLGDMVLTRIPIGADLLEATWELRHNVYAKDALYVALARAPGAELVTTDNHLAKAVPDAPEPDHTLPRAPARALAPSGSS